MRKEKQNLDEKLFFVFVSSTHVFLIEAVLAKGRNCEVNNNKLSV